MRAVKWTVVLATVALAGAMPRAGQSRPIVERLLEAYARGNRETSGLVPMSYDEFDATARALRSDAPAWFAMDPRRRLAVATYVLDLVVTNADVAWAPGGRELIEWACGLMRTSPAFRPAAEQAWYLASIAVFERLQGPPTVIRRLGGGRGASSVITTVAPYQRTPMAASHVGHAERRFPGLGAWALARVVAEELDTWPEHRDEQKFDVSNRRTSRLTTLFEAAAGFEDTRDEALVRWGYFELRRGRADAALLLFDRARDSDDLMLTYWLHLFKGRALEAAGRPADAVASYERALEAVPHAQSAALARGRALVAAGRRADAAAAVTLSLEVQPAPFDPWAIYSFPTTRRLPDLVGALREAIRP